MAAYGLSATDHVFGTISPKKRSSIRFLPRCRRKWAILIFTIFLYILLQHLPSAPQFGNDARVNRPPPKYDVETTPRFLYHSPFRQSPNHTFESEVSNALLLIEKATLSLKGESIVAKQRIWQAGLGLKERSEDSRVFEHENSDWEFQVVTDDWAVAFIRRTLTVVPCLWKLYTSYPYNVLRVDLLRYLLLWYYGGYYADMDVFPARSINSCPALQQHFSEEAGNVSLILGIEIDEPYASPRLMREWHWSRSYGFIQYTMRAPRRFSPLLSEAIVRVLAHTKQHLEQSSMFHGPRYDETTILEITGPGVFTDAILDHLSATLPPTVLPVSVWGNGQRHSGAEGFDSTQACINNRFGKSWKKGWWEYLFG
ncbi:uncharacterized protein ACLA_018770 [Aspergillus clavatus NRRL 1]|uniref:Uncharacterized protein n=1 Tax=Aspergillus clavatus (strain ATCC 1007 / CBS 513.65 / DSM 816 / NCTC 3887 / NRRL 1 / QM 1276 / 107) TaxID=344612 RepID=A1CNF2_ASPCL|nr:uncharacterized protein ACLA_018770 [Aspergillus clavatus NRRL 1]EAW07173.1 hypothetical protein ACLA_018770 [Aspergillus clavatus NRRL 1]